MTRPPRAWSASKPSSKPSGSTPAKKPPTASPSPSRKSSMSRSTRIDRLQNLGKERGMRRVISMSALVSSLLAMPALAARPRDYEPSPIIVPGENSVQQLRQILDTGPADIGGMQQLV